MIDTISKRSKTWGMAQAPVHPGCPLPNDATVHLTSHRIPALESTPFPFKLRLERTAPQCYYPSCLVRSKGEFLWIRIIGTSHGSELSLGVESLHVGDEPRIDGSFDVAPRSTLEPIFENAYAAKYSKGEVESKIDSHQLALLYIVLAMGARHSLELPQDDPSADDYMTLAKRSLAKSDFLTHCTIAAVQTLVSQVQALVMLMTSTSWPIITCMFTCDKWSRPSPILAVFKAVL